MMGVARGGVGWSKYWPCLLLLLLCACKVDLYTRLSEREATEMMAILLSRGIDAERVTVKDGTSTLQVEHEAISDAVAVLKANQLPRSEYTSMGEVFEQKGIVSSPIAERARLTYALSQELSRTLSDIDGVLTARVHVVLPRNDPLHSDSNPASAAVFIRHESGKPVAELVSQIKTLVAGSIEGLSYSKVAVILLPVGTAPSSALTLGALTKRGGAGQTMLGWLPWAGMVLIPLGSTAWLLWQRRRARREAQASAKPAPAGTTPLRKAA